MRGDTAGGETAQWEGQMALQSSRSAVAALFIAACTAIGSVAAAEDPPELPPHLQGHWKEHLVKLRPLHFAVSLDGRMAGYFYCDGGCAATNSRYSAIQLCERHSGGVDCDIYARGRHVVWKRAPFAAQKPVHEPEVSAHTSPGATETRSIAVVWEGYPGVLTGAVTVAYQDGYLSGRMTVVLVEDEEICNGRFWMTGNRAGRWRIDCTNEVSAEGHYVGMGAGKGARGEGDDNRGRKVQYILGATEGAADMPTFVEGRLRRVKRFLEQGLISDDEAEAKRREILRGL